MNPNKDCRRGYNMKYRRSLVCSRKGFTLVELIVVLVILAILAAM
ncbi:MAG: type II secretion system GspH family protein, partial [Lachnospiraceae bacterium]|nr:type II secretion system GspH family protein [Lachnospiraceae bacterium]